MKLNLIVLSGIFFVFCSGIRPKKTADPSGIYTYDGMVTVSDNDTYGYFGEIQVKKIAESRVAVVLYVCKGAPSYNSGYFIDTMDIVNNKALYVCPENDSSCRITLKFSKKGIKVEEITDDYNFGCGFGHGVVATGFFKKTSGEIPVLRHPMSQEEF